MTTEDPQPCTHSLAPLPFAGLQPHCDYQVNQRQAHHLHPPSPCTPPALHSLAPLPLARLQPHCDHEVNQRQAHHLRSPQAGGGCVPGDGLQCLGVQLGAAAGLEGLEVGGAG